MIIEDLHAYTESFGEEIIFTLANSETLQYYEGNKPLKGIFDNAFYDPSLGNIVIETTTPQLTCVESDVLLVKIGDTVIVRGEKYNVSQKQPDSQGMIILILEKC